MTNKEIAQQFSYLGSIMELHGENPFKIKSYANAYISLRKLGSPLSEMTDDEINATKGIGKSTAAKIRELLDTGKMEAIEKYKAKTPPGIAEMLNIKGFGPKKIKVIWKELKTETIGELLYACNENRLVELKGFGKKTQDALIAKLEYFLQSKGRYHYATLDATAQQLVALAQKLYPDNQVALTGKMRRKCNIVERIELLIDSASAPALLHADEALTLVSEGDNYIDCTTTNEYPVRIFFCEKSEFGSKLFRYSSAKGFIDGFLAKASSADFKGIETEEAVFEKAGIPFIQPELREQDWALELSEQPNLIVDSDIKGVVHSHTTYSDGIATLKQMADYSKQLGYEYIVITDHSQAAFYANGLKPDRVLEQFGAIDALNAEMDDFHIFKGIESDILNDGSLDYEEDILKQFDVIIASVHTNLRMDEAKATQRLITAIENPYTTILGHPTGRLLLSREGYPIDHQSVIDACAANGVAIELNAHPWRLDLDWTWIPYALEKGILISVNPDAHSMEGIHDIKYGVASARKGGLTAAQCLNAKGVDAFREYLK